MSTQTASTTMVSEFEAEMEAFPGKGLRKVDLRKAAPFGWTPAVLLGFVAAIDRADQTILGGALEKLKEEFGFNDFVAGILLSAPTIAALFLVIPAGRFADRRNRTILISIVITIWAFLSFGSAAAPTFAIFLFVRIVLGMATPLTIPASASIAGDLYTTRVRTKAFAVLRVFEYLGLPLGLVIGGVVSQSLGWRAAFLFMGVPALVLAAVVFFFLREPRRGLADEITALAEDAGLATTPITETSPRSPASNNDAVAQGPTLSKVSGPATSSIVVGTPPSTPDSGEPIDITHALETDYSDESVIERLRGILSIRSLRYIIIGQMLLFAGFAGLFSWVTIYLQRVFALEAGPASGITGGVGLIGLLLGGALSSRIGDRGVGKRKAWRITVAAFSLLFSALSVFIFIVVPILPLDIALFFVINFFNLLALSNLGAATADVIPASKRGTGFAIAQFLITIGSSVGALLVGSISAIVISQIGEGETVSALQIGVRSGLSVLIVLLGVGALVLFRARSTFEADAAAALAEAKDGFATPVAAPIH